MRGAQARPGARGGAARKAHPLDGAQRSTGEDGGPIVETLPGATGDPLAEALRRERLDELLGRAEGFSSLERAAIAHALVGCGPQETARRLGRRRKVVDNALRRARGKLAWEVCGMSDGTFRPELFGTPATRAWRVVRHVPRSQVWAGSRSGQTGRRHLEATANVSLEALSGRETLDRRRGQLLCGYEPWHKETIDSEETAPPPPRCPACEIKARRYGIKWPET